MHAASSASTRDAHFCRAIHSLAERRVPESGGTDTRSRHLRLFSRQEDDHWTETSQPVESQSLLYPRCSRNQAVIARAAKW